MGKSGGKAPKIPTSPLETEQANQIRDYYQGFQKPTRDIVAPQVQAGFANNDLFSGKIDPYQRDVLEGQFRNAKNQILNTAPVRGGMLQNAMTGLAKDRAMGVSGLLSQAQEAARNRLTGMLPSIFPNAAASQQAGIQLAQSDQNRLAQNTQMKAQSDQAFGQGLGGLLGNAMFGGGFGAGGKSSLLSSMMGLF